MESVKELTDKEIQKISGGGQRDYNVAWQVGHTLNEWGKWVYNHTLKPVVAE